MVTFTVCNEKGGVGKTLFAVNFAVALSQDGGKVLVIDNDKQGNASKFFGIDVEKLDDKSLAHLYLTDASVSDVALETNHKGISVIAGNSNLEVARLSLSRRCPDSWQVTLRNKLQAAKDAFDYVVIDNAPDTESALVLNSFTSSQMALIITNPYEFACDGVQKIKDVLWDDATAYNPQLKAICVFNKVRSDWMKSEYVKRVKKIFPVCKKAIRNAIPSRRGRRDFVTESIDKHKAVFELSPYCGFATDFVSVVNAIAKKEVIK